MMRLLLSACCFLFTFVCAHAQDTTTDDQQASVLVWSSKISKQLYAGSVTGIATVHAPTSSPTVFDAFRLTLTLRTPSPIDPASLDFRDSLPLDWLAVSEPIINETGTSPTETTVTITLEPLSSGELPLGFESVLVLESGPAPITVPTKTLQIAAVADPAPASHEDEPSAARPFIAAKTPLPIALIAAIVSGVVVFIVLSSACAVVLMKRSSRTAEHQPAAVDTRPPSQVALEELDQLLALQHIERSEFEAFFDGASGILRRYIERAIRLHAPRLTTDEFLREARRSERFSSHETQELSAFLSKADALKFARASETRDGADAAVGTVRRFVSIDRTPQSTPGGNA